MKNKFQKYMRRWKPEGMQSTVTRAFSLISVSIMLTLGIVMYMKFSSLSQREMIQDTETLVDQTRQRLEEYLAAMRQISDTVYNNVIGENDLSFQESKIQRGMNIVYEANRNHLRSIAVYSESGNLMAAEPVVSQRENKDLTHQSWFQKALEDMENMHFSKPHIQNLFKDGARQNNWVISLSRVVELTDKGAPVTGVLLVDMDFSGVSRMLQRINSNTMDTGQYYYLCDSNGEIIYHRKQREINSGSFRESDAAATYKDGVHGEEFEGEHRKLIIKTVGLTGGEAGGRDPGVHIYTGDV